MECDCSVQGLLESASLLGAALSRGVFQKVSRILHLRVSFDGENGAKKSHFGPIDFFGQNPPV